MRRFIGVSVITIATLAGVVGLEGATAAPEISVDACGEVLDVPGGTYVLRNDLVCTTEALAVTIAASGVRLNLAGHTILCADLGGVPTIGVYVAAGSPLTGLRITGGTVSGCSRGVFLETVYESEVRGMMLEDNLGVGSLGVGLLLLNSDDNRISDNSMSRNGAGCILVSSSGNRFSGNVMDDNVGPGCAIPGVPAGQVGSDDNVFLGNQANGNGNAGLAVGPNSTGNIVRGNTTLFNALSGISVFGRIVGNVIIAPIPQGNVVQGNTSFGNLLNDLSEILFDASTRTQSAGASCLNTWKSNDFELALGPTACIE